VKIPSLSASSLQVVLEPSKQNLVGGQAEQIVDGLALFAETIQFGMKFDVNLGKETSADDLPDETQDEVFSSVRDIRRADVDDGTADTLGRWDDDVVVLCKLECVEGLSSGRNVENMGVDRVWDGIVDEFTKDQAIMALVKELHRVCGDREPIADIRIILEDLSIE
jgi:hypothetical protein